MFQDVSSFKFSLTIFDVPLLPCGDCCTMLHPSATKAAPAASMSQLHVDLSELRRSVRLVASNQQEALATERESKNMLTHVERWWKMLTTSQTRNMMEWQIARHNMAVICRYGLWMQGQWSNTGLTVLQCRHANGKTSCRSTFVRGWSH